MDICVCVFQWWGRETPQCCCFSPRVTTSLSVCVCACACLSWACTLSTSPSIGDLHSFCRTGRAVVCLDGAFGTALADNWRQHSSCTIEFGEKICPYCTSKYVCDSYLHHMTQVLAANRLSSSSGLHRTDACSRGARWKHLQACLKLMDLTMSWSASTTG